MRVTEIDLQNIALIKLKGKLDMDSAELIARKAQNFLDKNRFKVIIDMGKVQEARNKVPSLENARPFSGPE